MLMGLSLFFLDLNMGFNMGLKPGLDGDSVDI